VFLSLWYVVLRRVLELAVLSFSVEAVQGSGNRRAAARTRHPPATNPSSGDDVDRPGLPRGGQPNPPARPLAFLHRDAVAPASVASLLGREAVDVGASSRAPADSPGGPSAGPPSRARQPAVGLSTHRRRTEGPWLGGVRDDGAHLTSGSAYRTDRHTRRDDMARVRPSAPPKPARRRFLHSRDDGCNNCTCSSSSNWAAAVYASRAARRIRVRRW
jgi:hypothetical protein